MTGDPDQNGQRSAAAVYAVRVEQADQGWEVRIVDRGGTVLSTRACTGAADARLFASTVHQHLDWLSPAKFREYYRL